MADTYAEDHAKIHPLKDQRCTCMCHQCYSRISTVIPTGILCICEECPCDGTH